MAPAKLVRNLRAKVIKLVLLTELRGISDCEIEYLNSNLKIKHSKWRPNFVTRSLTKLRLIKANNVEQNLKKKIIPCCLLRWHSANYFKILCNTVKSC